MILVDASILIDALRSRDPDWPRRFAKDNASICGVTVAEVLHGTRNQKDFDLLAASLASFPSIALPEELWAAVGRNLNALRIAGVTVPFADAVIATLAITSNIELWASDAHFRLIQKILPQLRLFQAKP